MISSSFRWALRHLRNRRSGDARDTFSDRMLAQRLYRTFEHGEPQADVHGIRFFVQSGVVTLYGTVRHEIERDQLTAAVRQIPGVKGVVERLQIVAPHYQDFSSFEE